MTDGVTSSCGVRVFFEPFLELDFHQHRFSLDLGIDHAFYWLVVIGRILVIMTVNKLRSVYTS
ncbi:hypothetical protein SBF1_8570001 [Candidatus Desulfosporosinus infrequens]|uniref:Uncharacterized protein n=1 Tax=Candidatus Desulfosporosinus infrequens TaxID=2043169 RepID=A0A2U3LV18_9FIRM|nr:hypothetical protein SBF1_8570001 [Candidatus Desulfosporosinus infrequens]